MPLGHQAKGAALSARPNSVSRYLHLSGICSPGPSGQAAYRAPKPWRVSHALLDWEGGGWHTTWLCPCHLHCVMALCCIVMWLSLGTWESLGNFAVGNFAEPRGVKV